MVKEVREELIESEDRVVGKKRKGCYKFRKICAEAQGNVLRKWGKIYKEEREEL